MSAKPRITLQFQKGDDGVITGVDLLLNAEGLSLLIGELTALSESNDHFHLFSPELDPGGDLSEIPYDKGATVGSHLKVLFRPDQWDREHYPHLFRESEE